MEVPIYTPRQALARTGVTAPLLPSPYFFMDERKWKLRRGHMVMVAGAPNVGKSAFALDLVSRLKLRTLFVSADTDAFTMAVRLASRASGYTTEQIEKDPLSFAPYIQQENWMRMTFEAGPTLEDLDEEVCAASELWGAPPEVIVIDNLMNVETDDEEFHGLRIVLKSLHRLTRTTGALVLVLHHVTGGYEDGDTVPPRSALHGKVAKLPEMVFTLGARADFVGIACVKNRSGPADPLAKEPVWMNVDLSCMKFREPYQ